VKIETGENPNPTLGTLQKIAKALGVEVEKLLKN
jgi:transcriptional regulator with XRE-family HTH domain